MRNMFTRSAGLALCLLICGLTGYSQSKIIRVALYDDISGSGAGPKNFELCLRDSTKFFTKRIKAADIRNGILHDFDVLIQPGGSGSKQGKNLEVSGRDSIVHFVKRGGGYLGVCAGAYLATADYEWSLDILNAKVIDREHWNRGNGKVAVSFSNKGKKFFGLKEKVDTIGYFQGPLMAPAGVDSLPKFRSLAVFKTEIVKNGAIPGIMIGTTAIAQAEYGKGRVVAVSPHPEKVESQRYMIAKIVTWLAN
jgi:glutamine amidotransferase-like uncharacterized protein